MEGGEERCEKVPCVGRTGWIVVEELSKGGASCSGHRFCQVLRPRSLVPHLHAFVEQSGVVLIFLSPVNTDAQFLVGTLPTRRIRTNQKKKTVTISRLFHEPI